MSLGIELGVSQQGTSVPHAGDNLLLADAAALLLLANGMDALVLAGGFVPALLDGFNRADGGLGANWTKPTNGAYNAFQISSNQVARGAENDNAAIWNTQYAADQEVEIQVPVLFDNAHLLRLCVRNQSATEFAACYYGEFERGASSSKIRLYRYDGATATQLGAEVETGQLFADNDRFGVRAQGTTLSAWLNRAQVASRTDATVSGAGRLLVNVPVMIAACRLDDFRGGAL